MEFKAKKQCLTVYDPGTKKLLTLTMEKEELGAAAISKLEFECNASLTYGWKQLVFDLDQVICADSESKATKKDIMKASCHWSFKVRAVIRDQKLVLFDSSGQDEGVLTGLKNTGGGRSQVCSIILGKEDRNLELYRYTRDNTEGVLTLEAELEVVVKLEHIPGHSHDHLYSTEGLFASKRGNTSDVTIKCGNGEFKAHKNVLTCCSPVFARMLTSPLDESLTNVIKIEDFEAETIKDMITFMYGGTLQASSAYSLVALLDCGEKYDIPELKDFAVKLMLATATPENAIEFAGAVVKFGCDDNSQKEIFRYCKSNFEKLNIQPNFRQFFKDNVDVFLNC